MYEVNWTHYIQDKLAELLQPKGELVENEIIIRDVHDYRQTNTNTSSFQYCSRD